MSDNQSRFICCIYSVMICVDMSAKCHFWPSSRGSCITVKPNNEVFDMSNDIKQYLTVFISDLLSFTAHQPHSRFSTKNQYKFVWTRRFERSSSGLALLLQNKSKISTARRHFPLCLSYVHRIQSKYYAVKFTKHLLIFLSNRTQLLLLVFRSRASALSSALVRRCKQTTHIA